MNGLPPDAQRALDSYTRSYTERIVQIADALTDYDITSDDIDQAVEMMDIASRTPPAPIPTGWWLLGQSGAIMAGGAGGALFTPSDYTILQVALLVAGLCLLLAARIREMQGPLNR